MGKELPSVIWNMFACISDERQDNYIAGFSNGGYGCLHTALSYPQKFAGVGAFSAGDKADSDFSSPAKQKSRLLLFGEGDLHENDYGLTHLAWRKGWANSLCMPQNAVTGAKYRGIKIGRAHV